MTAKSSESSELSFFERLEQTYGDPPASVLHGTPPYRDQKLMMKHPTHKIVLLLRAIQAFSPRSYFNAMSYDSKFGFFAVLTMLSIISLAAVLMTYVGDRKEKQSLERNVMELQVTDRYWACVQTTPQCVETNRGVDCRKTQTQINAGIAEIPADGCTAPNSSLLSYLILGESKPGQRRRSDKIWVTASDYAAHPIGSPYFVCLNGRQKALAWMTEPLCPPHL